MGRYTLNRRFAPSAGRTLAQSPIRRFVDSSIRRVGTRAAAPPARDSVRHVARMPRSRRHAVVGLKSDAHVKAARMRAASASHDAALRCASAPVSTASSRTRAQRDADAGISSSVSPGPAARRRHPNRLDAPRTEACAAPRKPRRCTTVPRAASARIPAARRRRARRDAPANGASALVTRFSLTSQRRMTKLIGMDTRMHIAAVVAHPPVNARCGASPGALVR
ncbi:conserved hypothetical protein [Burkholderia pseudomallei 668]|nr:conserved hypothetical protein [Burkholderia pseudomallei 668]